MTVINSNIKVFNQKLDLVDIYDISIVIVNYNVKDYLIQCLRSIDNSISNLKIQTIVVDNNSTDGSIDFLTPLFPDVTFVQSSINLGFSKANNLGFKYSNSKYILILNPDTIISENTLDVMFEFMEANSNVGLAGCKVLNPDGSFQLACRRGFPTPWVAFTKLFGLQKLFPKSKLFAGYNLTYLDENETNDVDALIGAFMFVKTDLINQINGFDEDFFMYGEDLDLCYRIHKLGYKIKYLPQTTIVHFKGESTRRSNIDELHHFFEAMKIYAEKHYNNSKLFLMFLKCGINLRYLIANLNKFKKDIKYIFSDILIVNSLLLLSTKLLKGEYFWFPDYAYPLVFFVVPLVTLLSKFSIGEYFEGNKSTLRIIYSQLITFFALSSLTYFFKDYAFSRGIILLLILLSTILMIIQLLIENQLNKKKIGKNKRIIIIGDINKNSVILQNIENNEINSVIVGFVYNDKLKLNLSEFNLEKSDLEKSDLEKSTKINHKYNYIGHIDYLPKLIQDYFANEIIVTNENINKQIFTNLKYKNLDFKDKFHFIDNYEELQVSRIQNEISLYVKLTDNDILPIRYRVFKRLFDVSISTFLLSIGFPLLYLFFEFDKNLIKSLILVLKGQKSIIGIETINEKSLKSTIDNNFKKGIITLNNIFLKSEKQSIIEKLDKLYIEHYSISLDFELLIKYLVNKNGK